MSSIDQKRKAALERRSACALRKRPVVFNVAGISHRKGNCNTLLRLPAECFRIVKLKPEHGNPADPFAIMVIVNDLHVGYVPRTLTGRVRGRLSPATPPRLLEMKRFQGRDGSDQVYAKIVV